VHPAVADALTGCVLELLAPQPGEWALDLYSGVGLFAGVLAERLGPTGRVVAIEGDRGAVDDARHNLAELSGVRLLRGRVDRTLPRIGWHRADLVVLDPPRSGAGRAVVERISGYRPRAIGYVACDPAALARDLGYFAGHRYRLADLRGYDVFPMTHHVECVALLTPTEPDRAAGRRR
jgi:tRNA/tmRNA/rRNA uracil-C5-methylase (TrmA/RlmC/RlmD family)